MNRLPPVIVAGQFPPPVTGFSHITQKIADILGESREIARIDLAPHRQRKGVSYHMRRVALTLKGLAALAAQRKKSAIFYMACEGNWGLIYTIALTAAARFLGYAVCIHHHSFGYIERHSFLMPVLLAAAGKKTTHIFLCPLMAERFAAGYRARVKTKILSNSAFIPPAAPRQRVPGGIPAIGLLSNLNNEKGLQVFIDLVRAAAAQGFALRAILAGPAQDDAGRAAIERARYDLGARFDYRGAVYGEAKNAFFRDIDIFIFPTLYANEAEPAVLFETLSHGIPVLSFDRGCIRGQVQEYGAVAERGGDFVPFALDWLRTMTADPEKLARLQAETQSAYARRHAREREKITHLFGE